VKNASQFFKALADETRLKMLWLLLNHKELCVCDITEALDITQSKASRHLATLRHAGLVVDRREAAWSYYSICPVESELEKAQLRVLRTKLSEYPDATQVLNDLQAWLDRKDRDATCAWSRVYPTAAKNKPKSRARAQREGRSR